MAGKSRSLSPGRRSRLRTKIQRAKLGSTRMFLPPIWRKKLECPMKVTPNSPRRASTGLRVTPVRAVRAECRTKVPNCLALRRIVIPNMGCAY